MAKKAKKKADLGPVHMATLRCVASHSVFCPPLVLVCRCVTFEEERRYPSSCIRTFLEGDLHRRSYRVGDDEHRSMLGMLASGAWELLEADGMTRMPDALPE